MTKYSLETSKMLDKAFKQLKDGDFPILHSDQGWHYQMKQYRNTEKTRNYTKYVS
jgi:putative transposase